MGWEREGMGGGGVDQQKAALKLLNTPTIASNCVQLCGATFVQ